jgi:ribosomal protein L31E
MKFNKEIKEFLEKHININQSRLDNARSKTAWSIEEEKK